MIKQNKLTVLVIGILIILISSCTNSNDKLYTAIAKGSLSEVEEIIESGVDINYKYKNDRNKSEHTALHYAVKYHEYDIAELLIEKGANVNAVDIYGWHPLLYAVNDGNLKLSELLLKNGANLEQKNSETGNISIDYAISNNDTNMINLLLKYEPKNNNIMFQNKIKTQTDSSELILNVDAFLAVFHDCVSYNCKINEVIKGQITDTLIHLVLDIKNFNNREKKLPTNINSAVPVKLELGFISVEKNALCINGFIDKNKNNWKIIYLKSITY